MRLGGPVRSHMSADSSGFERQRWSTPLRDYRAIRSRRVWTHGHARWHPPDAYVDGELVDVEASPDRPERPDASTGVHTGDRRAAPERVPVGVNLHRGVLRKRSAARGHRRP
jgi:hypothetical protein